MEKDKYHVCSGCKFYHISKELELRHHCQIMEIHNLNAKRKRCKEYEFYLCPLDADSVHIHMPNIERDAVLKMYRNGYVSRKNIPEEMVEVFNGHVKASKSQKDIVVDLLTCMKSHDITLNNVGIINLLLVGLQTDTEDINFDNIDKVISAYDEYLSQLNGYDEFKKEYKILRENSNG